MEMTQPQPSVGTPTTRYRELETSRELVRDLYGGTKAMIAAGEKWLLKLPGEDEANYKTRLHQNILTNFVKQAVGKSAGKIFSKPITLKDDVPEEIQTLCKNVDRQGRNIDAYFFHRAKGAFLDGISYVLVDMPTAVKAVTRADEKAQNIKPYLVDVDANALLECTSEMIGASQVLSRIRILEVAKEPNGEWGQKEIKQVRVLQRVAFTNAQGNPDSLVYFAIYRENPADKKWYVWKSGTTSFKEIPLFPIYANMTDFMEGEPVFQETAELNLEHWRSKSEQLNALMFGRFAMLGGSGVKSDDQVTVGPAMKLFTSDPQGKFYYVESNGVGMDQGWKHLQSIEKAIETASATLRIENQGRVTATAAAIDSDETNSMYKVIALGMKECIERIFDVLGECIGLGEDKGGHVELNTNFGTSKGSDVGLQEIGKLVVANKLSPQSAILNLIWRGELPNDFDAVQNQAEIDALPPTTLPTPEQIAKGKANAANKQLGK
jgi:hypothetical protein